MKASDALTNADTKTPPAAPGLRSVAWRVWLTYLTPYRWRMLFAALSGALVAATTGAISFILKPAIDQIFGAHPPQYAWIYFPLAIVALAIGRAVGAVFQVWTTNTVGHKVVGQMQADLFASIIRSDLARLRGSHSGTIVSSMLYDASLVRTAATSSLINYLRESLILVSQLVVMMFNDWTLTLGVLLVGPLASLLIQRFSRWVKKAATKAMNETAGFSTAVMEGIDGVKIVKIDNREAYETDRVSAAIGRRQIHIIKGANIGASLAPTLEVVGAFALGGAIAYAAWQHAHGQITVGGFTSFALSLGIASQSLRQLGVLQSTFVEGFTAAQRMIAQMDVRPEVAEAPKAMIMSGRASRLALDDVTFSYGVEGEGALRGVSIQVSRGETIALVGPSGGGKSTILNLIPRFYDVTGGSVTVDGEDTRTLTLASLRDQIALVTQETFLFDDTIRANIAYPRPDASQDEIEAAAREAAAHDFILDLPNGYDTQVGEAGSRLSGGQRQRIAIARAFLKNAPILLLDEATSALDTESEAQVQAALEHLMEGRATVVIAHRLSTVKNADRIYVIERGQVVEQGAHATLMRARGLYARLAQAQDLEPTTEAAE
jgi:subfamily B ATP-binding cassette protein MsbA